MAGESQCPLCGCFYYCNGNPKDENCRDRIDNAAAQNQGD